MKILLVHHCDSWGGAGVSLRDTCQMLCAAHDVTVCLPHLNTEVDNELQKVNGLKTIAINDNMGMISAYNGGPKVFSRTFVRNLLKTHVSQKKLCDVIAKGEYDIVILNSITLAWAAKLCKKLNIPAVIYIRETKVNNLGYYLCKSLINKFCSGILFISEHDKKTMGLKVEKQAVVKDCLDFDQYDMSLTREESSERFGLDSSKFNLLYVGGTDELKGYSVIISAMSKISEPPIQLIVAGGVNEEKRIDADNIMFLGKVFDMPTLYRACNALVFPSIKGHQARPVFEAGAAHLPVIISDFPQTADEVTDGKNGLTFEPCNTEALKDKILSLYKSPELCKRLGEKNYENAFNNHAFTKVQCSLSSFLKSY